MSYFGTLHPSRPLPQWFSTPQKPLPSPQADSPPPRSPPSPPQASPSGFERSVPRSPRRQPTHIRSLRASAPAASPTGSRGDFDGLSPIISPVGGPASLFRPAPGGPILPPSASRDRERFTGKRSGAGGWRWGAFLGDPAPYTPPPAMVLTTGKAPPRPANGFPSLRSPAPTPSPTRSRADSGGLSPIISPVEGPASFFPPAPGGPILPPLPFAGPREISGQTQRGRGVAVGCFSRGSRPPHAPSRNRSHQPKASARPANGFPSLRSPPSPPQASPSGFGRSVPHNPLKRTTHAPSLRSPAPTPSPTRSRADSGGLSPIISPVGGPASLFRPAPGGPILPPPLRGTGGDSRANASGRGVAMGCFSPGSRPHTHPPAIVLTTPKAPPLPGSGSTPLPSKPPHRPQQG